MILIIRVLSLISLSSLYAIKSFNKKTGKPIDVFSLSRFDAKFLNDIAVDGRGFIYASDTMTNRIFKLRFDQKKEVSVFERPNELIGPNGLFLNPKTKNLMVVTLGSGEILEIDHAGKIHVLKRGLLKLDGVDYDNQGNLYVSSFEKGEIYKIPHMGRGVIETFMSGLTTPADISCDRMNNELLIPSFQGNQVITVPLKRPS